MNNTEENNGSWVWILIIVAAVWFWSSSQNNNSSSTNYSIDNSLPSEESCYYLEPDNPYDIGSGHYAGFDWAQENDVSSCGGNSLSFVEGCEEYLDQLEAYDSCLEE